MSATSIPGHGTHSLVACQEAPARYAVRHNVGAVALPNAMPERRASAEVDSVERPPVPARIRTMNRATKVRYAAQRVAVCLTVSLVFIGRPASSLAADQATGGPQGDQAKQDSQKQEALEEVVVTGTHIRGVSPASPLIVLTSTDIANSGLSTSGEVFRALPQSFAGGQQSMIGVHGAGPYQNLSNFNNSDSANLRGFGSDSTLVLINGRRAPVTGFQGSVDISAIPLVAIDRVEIVTDGASALYGSDAVGGVVNFILKQNYSGADTSAEVGYPTDGGGASQRYGQLLGTAWNTGSMMFAYQYRDQQGLYGDQRSWWTGPNPYSLVGSIHQNSAYLDLSQTATPDLRFFAQGLYNHTSSVNLSTSAGTTKTTSNDTTGYSYAASIGATLTLLEKWELTSLKSVTPVSFRFLRALAASYAELLSLNVATITRSVICHSLGVLTPL